MASPPILVVGVCQGDVPDAGHLGASSSLLFAVMSEIGEIIVDMDNNDNMENSEAPADEPPILHTKKFRIGSGNIIGKCVIQDFFFTCAGALPSMGYCILHRTSSLADAISTLVVELERQFMHMHPCIQRIFLEFSNIEHSSVKHDVTILLAHEFRFIIREAKEIFAHYRVDAVVVP